jgi:hypothetical protein
MRSLHLAMFISFCKLFITLYLTKNAISKDNIALLI